MANRIAGAIFGNTKTPEEERQEPQTFQPDPAFQRVIKATQGGGTLSPEAIEAAFGPARREAQATQEDTASGIRGLAGDIARELVGEGRYQEAQRRRSEPDTRRGRGDTPDDDPLAEMRARRGLPHTETIREGAHRAASETQKDLTMHQNLQLGLTEGGHMMAVGAGTALESFGEWLQAPKGPGGPQAPQEIFDAIENTIVAYGENLRHESAARMAELAHREPETFFQEAMRETARMAPLVAVGTAAGIAGGLPAALAGVVGTSYPVEKGFLQNELEDAGLSANEADIWSSAGAVPIAAAESAFEVLLGGRVGRLAGGGLGEAVKKGFAKRIARVALRIGEGSLVEGSTEALQEGIGLATRAAATGELPTLEEALPRLASAARAGALGGGVFGGGFGFVGEVAQEHAGRVNEAVEERVQALAADFKHEIVPVGTQIGSKVKTQDSRGLTRWRDVESGQLTTAPQPDEVAEHYNNQLRDRSAEADAAMETDERAKQPMDVPVESASARLMQFADEGTDPAQVALNVRRRSVARIGNAMSRVGQMTQEEIAAEAAELEALALDPTSDDPLSVRIDALARKNALQYAARDQGPRSIHNLDVTSMAEAYAALDEVRFDQLANKMEARGDEIELRILREARALREADEVQSESAQVRERLGGLRRERSRGFTEESEITVDGQVGKVTRVRPSGFLDVYFAETDQRAVVDPNDATPVLHAGQTVKLATGEVVTVEEVGETEARATLPNGNPTMIPADGSTVDVVGGQAKVRETLTDDRETQVEALDDERRAQLPTTIEAIDTRTGQTVEIAATGENTVQLADGTVLPFEQIQIPGEDTEVTVTDPETGTETTGTVSPRRVSRIAETGEIQTFEPGTQPESEGRHINFLVLPEADAAMFEEALKRGSDVVNSWIDPNLYLLPQPPHPGTRMYAIEMPADARELTGASKKVLGFLGGKDTGVTRSTLQGRVRRTRLLDPSELGVMRVPEGLRGAASGVRDVHGMSTPALRDYTRRLADLGFDINPRVAESLGFATETAQNAAQARIAGDAGAAEVLEIEAQTARAEAGQVTVEEEISEREAVWESIKDTIREAIMDAPDISMLDALNATTREQLLDIPQVGPTTADRIIKAREEGGITKVEQLADVEGIGPSVMQNIIEVLRSRSGPAKPYTRIGEQHEQDLRVMLDLLPPRTGKDDGWAPVFEHPRSPGMRLIIDKERITTPVETEEGVQAGERDIYHIIHKTPEGHEIVSRTIGHRTSTVEVPASQIEDAQATIARELREGRALDDIVEGMLASRQETEVVHLVGEGNEQFRVIRQDEDGVLVQGERGEPFQVDPNDIVDNVGTDVEPTLPVPVAQRLTPNEVISEVIREVRKFDSNATWSAAGEWRSPGIPGLYADIRARPDGSATMAIFKKPLGRNKRADASWRMETIQSFDTREEAVEALEEAGFIETPTAMSRFRDLPAVQDILPENMYDAHDRLTSAIESARMRAHVPQALRDYAIRFAQRWSADQLAMPQGGLFNRRDNRRAVGVFDVGDSRSAARTVDPDAVLTTDRPDIIVEGGNMVVEAYDPAVAEADPRVLRGHLINPKADPTDPSYLDTAKKVYESTKHRERFYDMIEEDGVPPQKIQRISRRLVRIQPDGRLGIVLDSQPTKDYAVVQVIEEGTAKTVEVKKENVRRVRNLNKANDYYRAVQDGLGEMTNMPVTPEMGSSPYDQKLGLDLVDEREPYIEGLRRKVAQAVEGLGLAEDGTITGDATLIDNVFVPAFIRMRELGIENRALPAELDGEANDAFQVEWGETLAEPQGLEDIDAKSPLIPPALLLEGGTGEGPATRGLVPGRAFEEIANTFSIISPYGDVMARAKLGLLSIPQRNAIESQAKEFGVDPDLPLYRKVEFLMQNAWDPKAAHMLYQMRNDVGAFMALADGIPDQGIEIRMPAMGSSIHTNLGAAWITPREMANRHPTIRILHTLAERDRTDFGNKLKRLSEAIRGLQGGFGRKATLERKNVVWGLLQSEALGEAMDRPTEVLTKEQIEEVVDDLPTSWNWYEHYQRIRNILVELRRENLRNSLLRGFHPEELGADVTTQDKLDLLETLKKNNDLTQGEYNDAIKRIKKGEKFYDLDRNSNALYARPRSEVNLFLSLQDKYFNADEIPQEVIDDLPAWMVDEFNFWARWGINNYVPQVLQGRMKIRVRDPETGEFELRAFAPDVKTAVEFIYRVRKNDPAIEGIAPDAEFEVEFGKARPDFEVDLQYLGGEKFKRLYGRAARILGDEGGIKKLAKIMSQELRIGSEPAQPKNLHTQARTSDLADIIEDPYERLLIYGARSYRNTFLLNIENAYETAKGMDQTLSRGMGIETVRSHEIASRYMKDLRDSYMGEQTSGEKNMNRIISFLNSFEVSPSKIRRLKKRWEEAGPDYSLLDDPLFNEGLYNEDYTARRWADNAVAFQSVWKLGLNFMGAAVNATQHMMYTPYYLIARGVPVADAYAAAIGGYIDTIKYLREMSQGDGSGPLNQFAEDVGVAVVPARGLAGPGMGAVGETRALVFSDTPTHKKIGKTAAWAAMLPFAKAERSVRLAGGFAARRIAQKGDMSHGAQVEFARGIIDNTQFQYYDQALPPFMRSPAARVLLQFKPFVVNALKFEKDLLRGSMPANAPFARAGTFEGMRDVLDPVTGRRKSASAQARKAFFLFNTMGRFVMGGALGVAMSPALLGVNWLLRLFGRQGIDQLVMQALGDFDEELRNRWGNYVGDPELLAAEKVVLYGLPGLLGLNLSARLGVSGLDIDPTRPVDMAGPWGSTYIDTYKMLLGEGGFLSGNRAAGAAGVSAGALSQFAGARFPYGMIAAPMLATELSSAMLGRQRLDEFLRNEEVGKQWVRDMSARPVRGAARAWDIWDPSPEEGVGYTHDAQGNETRYPGGLNRTFETIVGITGGQTIRDSQLRAIESYMYHIDKREQELRRKFKDEAATLYLEQGVPLHSPRITEIINASVEAGMIEPIDRDDIQEEIDRRQMGPVERSSQQLSNFLSTGGRNIP